MSNFILKLHLNSFYCIIQQIRLFLILVILFGEFMKKKTLYSELAYVFGIITLALGTALTERTDFGVSMVVAPAYLLHLKLSELLPFFTFGVAEYTLQALILIFMMIILKKAKLSYLFSFITAVIYGFVLDGSISLVSLLPYSNFGANIVYYCVGLLLCTFGISLLFHTYISPEAYELFVKEISAKYNFDIHKCKTIYDCVSCVISIILSFAFFGFWQFEGVKLGTIICALVNGSLIAIWSKILEKNINFTDRFKFRKYFN
jgi:uncharacterized membrane protein YczE